MATTRKVAAAQRAPAKRVAKPKPGPDLDAVNAELAAGTRAPEPDYSYLEEGAPEMGEEDAKASLVRVSAMADRLRKHAQAVIDAQAVLDLAQANYTRIEQQDFPELLREVGLSKMELEDGTKLELLDDIQCGISEDRKPRAFDWLRRYSFDGLIKTQVVLAFDRDEMKQRDKLLKLLEKAKFQPEMKQSVHPATLKSFLKEQRSKPILDTDTVEQKAAKQPPVDVFGIHPFSKVKLTAAKEPKAPARRR